jgi:hypothetical protein
MAASRKPGLATARKQRQLEPATFKNSLRSWQARWKALKAAQAELLKDPTQSAAPAPNA